jgi:hypothetical protein
MLFETEKSNEDGSRLNEVERFEKLLIRFEDKLRPASTVHEL